MGNQDFVRKVEFLSFVPARFLDANFTMPAYQASRYGELSARAWPDVRVAHALPDLDTEAEGEAVLSFASRLCSLLAGIPKI